MRVDSKILKVWEQNIGRDFYANISNNYGISIKKIRSAITKGYSQEYIIESINQYIKQLNKSKNEKSN